MTRKIKMVDVRKFNEKGLEEFESFLSRVKNKSGGSSEMPPFYLLDDPHFSDEIKLSGHIKSPKRINIHEEFEDRMDFADHLCCFIKTEDDVAKVVYDKFAGAWLALAYFEQICSKDAEGKWKLGHLDRYVPNIHNPRRFYRHLVCSIVAVFSLHRKRGRLVLSGPTHEHPDFLEQLASRNELLVNKSLMSVIDKLYWDSKTKAPKVGAAANVRPFPDGSLRRFVGPDSFYEMYQTTFDFWSMTPEEILAILPREFEHWMN